MKSDLWDLVNALRLSQATIRNIKENLFWAFFYNTVGIPVAAGALYGFGLVLNPMLGAAAMSLSSVCVVSNALRLNFFKAKQAGGAAAPAPVQNKNATPAQAPAKGETNMQKTIHIEGMSCGHCTARVEKALRGVPGVAEVTADLETKSAAVTLNTPVDDEVLKATVEAEGYQVTGVQ